MVPTARDTQTQMRRFCAFFSSAQEHIAVINFTVQRQHMHGAQPAFTAPAAVLQGLHTVQLQSFEQAAISRHRDG